MKKRGFTLVEIMIVVGMVGLLATMGSLAILKGVNTSRKKQAEAEVEVISAAVLQLAWDTGKWPNGEPRNTGGDVEMWDLSLDRCGLLANDGTYNNWKGPYYDGPITDPWGENYYFDPDYSTANGSRIVVGSCGPNKKGQNIYDSDNIYVFLDD